MIASKTKLQGFVGVSLRDPLNFYILKALMITLIWLHKTVLPYLLPRLEF